MKRAVNRWTAWLALALLGVAVLAAPVMAQTVMAQSLAGLWHCTVNAQSNDPAGNYGLDVQVEVAGDGTLFAKGIVIYHGLMNPITQVQGYGDWTVLPPEPPANQSLVKFRMMPGNHPIISWFARPAGPGQMYNLFSPQPQNGRISQVETQCSKFG